jgi:hypothetical protein
VSHLRLAWPGIALTITMFDDVVAGPAIALGVAILGPLVGIPVALVVFTALILALAWSAMAASRRLDPAIQVRIDGMVAKAAGRRFIGRHVRRVGDDHLVATALVAAVISPVFAVLLARLIHPAQGLGRTALVSALAYGAVFSLGYAAGGSVLAGLT